MAGASEGRPAVWAGHVVLYSRDPKGAGAFYEDLGMRVVAAMEPFAVLEMRGGTHLVLRRDPECSGGPAGFDMMVEDLDATWQAWQSQGVPVSEIGQDALGNHRVFTVTDPDGNTLVVNDSHVVGEV